MSAAAIRTTAVQRLSWRDELANVVRGGMSVVILVWIYLGATLNDTNDGRRALLPYQTVIQSRPSVDQRMFRELQEGLLEAEAARSVSGEWPAPEALAGDGIPPFALDPTARGASYRWVLLRDGRQLNYLGRPIDRAAPAWLLVVQEPEPGVPPDQTFEDEEHHKLLDGTMLHISTWVYPDGQSRPERLTIAPQVEGWQQVYAVGPAVVPSARP
jgi:hypothetical protein